MDLLSTAFFTFYIVLSFVALTSAIAFFTYKGVKQHLKEARLGRGCVLITDEELAGRR